MVRVKSADFPLSAIAGVKAPPQGTGVREIEEGVYISGVVVVVCVCCFTYSRAQKGVW